MASMISKLAKEGKIDKPILIALSSHSSDKEISKCIESGFNDFLSKPLQEGKLL